MINENEIRVGNYYNRIDTVNDSKLGYHKWDSSDWYKVGECIDYFEHYEPIPLTEEILLKCGGKIDKDFNETCDFGYLTYNIISKQIYFGMESVKIEYLHQLQNLYFALIGEELTVNL